MAVSKNDNLRINTYTARGGHRLAAQRANQRYTRGRADKLNLESFGVDKLESREKIEQMEQQAASGRSSLQCGNWDEAEKAYSAAMRTAKELERPVSEAFFRCERGQARWMVGNLEGARQDFEHSLAVANSRTDCGDLAAYTGRLLANLDMDAGDYSKAADRLISALKKAAQEQHDGLQEDVLGDLGRLYMADGNLEAAAEAYRQALSLSAGSSNEPRWLGNLGQALAELGQYEESIELYQQALELARTTGDTGAQSQCYASAGLSHLQKNEYVQAIECYQEALKLAQEENDIHCKTTFLGSLGNVYLRMGELERAAQLTQEGLQLAQQIDDKHTEAAQLDTLGDCCFERGDVEKALTYYTDALQIGRSISDTLGERIYLSNVARAHKRMGNVEKALDYFRQAVRLFEIHRSNIKNDHLKTSFATTGQNLYRDTIQACLESGNRVEALEYVGLAKSRAILDLLRNSPIDIAEVIEGSTDESVAKLAARERELSAQIARLERIYWQGPFDAEPGHRGATVSAEDAPKLYSEWRDVIDQLKRLHPNYASMVVADALGFDDLCNLWQTNGAHSALPEDTAVIEFFISDQFLLSAAVWAKAAQPELNIVFDSKDIAGLLNDVSDFLEMSSTEGWEVPLSLCKRIYSRLFGTMGAALPAHINRLILIPHGILHRLPFAALHDGHSYLIERFSLSYLPSSSLIPILSESHDNGHSEDSLKYLVSAISDYSATRTDGIVFSSRLRSAAGLEDLSYVLEEGKTVYKLAAQHASEAKLLTNEEVKEGLLSFFSNYPVVHFAGHAVFNPDEPMASGLVLADGSILTAARILHTNKLRTKCGKLLVLSACQTGVNVITNGGEILGLARVLMYAGMPNLILSLWEVADRSTAELMQNFHNAWQAGKTSIASALASAQRSAAREGQPIHAWAPFIHLGID